MASFGLYRLIDNNYYHFRLVTKFIFQLKLNINFNKIQTHNQYRIGLVTKFTFEFTKLIPTIGIIFMCLL